MRHSKICRYKPVKEELLLKSEEIKTRLEKELVQKEIEINESNKKLEEKEKEIQAKDEQITFLKGILEYQLSKPTIVNNNYKTTSNTNSNSNNTTNAIKTINLKQVLEKMEPLEHEDVSNFIHLYNEKYIDQGPEGYAYFLCHHPHKQKFITTDNARNVLCYKTKNKDMVRDPDGTLLFNKSLKNNADVIIEKARTRKNYWKDQIDDEIEEYQTTEFEKIKNISELITITKNAKDNKVVKSQEMLNVLKKNGYNTIQKFIEEERFTEESFNLSES